MRTQLTCCFIGIIVISACTNLFPGIRVVKPYTQSPHMLVSVFPVADTQGDRQRSETLTETFCHELRSADLVSIVPLWEQIDESWIYEPSFVYTEHDTSWTDPEKVYTGGGLRRIERVRLVPSIAAEWIIDAVYIHDTPYGKLNVDVWHKDAGTPALSIGVKVQEGDSLIEASENAAEQINRFFFDFIAPDRVRQILNRYDAGTLTSSEAENMLNGLDSRFPESVFVAAGKMILFQAEKRDDAVVFAGRKWFAQRNIRQDEQNRFFQSLNFNPYLIYGDALLAIGLNDEAIKSYSLGMETFPYNTPQLEKKYFFYRKLPSKSQ